MILDGPEHSDTVIILAHGAGQPMDSPFMDFFAHALAKHSYRVARFEFPYMAKRRTTGKRPGPDRAPKLKEAWLAAIGAFPDKRLVIGGKSMGGRIASLVAEEAGADPQLQGLVCLGYPFHPVGKPEKLRTEHLATIETPTLIVQGTRDTFGKPDEVKTYKLAKTIDVHWLEDGDHSFKPRKKSGRTQEQNWNEGVEAIHRFVATL